MYSSAPWQYSTYIIYPPNLIEFELKTQNKNSVFFIFKILYFYME